MEVANVERIVTIVERQSYLKLIKLIIGGSKYGKNCYDRRKAELFEINQVDYWRQQMWKKSLQS